MKFKNNAMKTNRSYRVLCCLAILVGCLSILAQNQSLPQLGKNSVSEVVAAMTLEEKASLVVGNGFYVPGMSVPGLSAQVKEEQKKVPGVAGTTCAIPRLGIPSLVMSDGPSGIDVYDSGQKRVYYATWWPSPTLTASSWDTAVARKVGAAFGYEVKEYGIDIILGPGLNIHRNPLGGRNYEYYSEDPVITGNIAAAMVNGIQSNGVGTSVKHFAANNQETNRQTVNTIVSERAMREIYLKGWEIAVKKAQPWTVMSSYNLINGTYTAERYDLITGILKKEWGFKGLVMTDWFGGKDPVAMMNSGNNLIMPGSPEQSKIIIEAVKNGEISQKVLDENVAGILNIILQSPSFKGYKYSDNPDLYKDAQIARKAASEGMVLLKNADQVLPIDKAIHVVSLFGNNGYELIPGGRGGGAVNIAYKISLAEGLARSGYTVERTVYNAYTSYLATEGLKRPKKYFIQEFASPTPPIPQMTVDIGLIKKTAAISDLAIICISRNAGEGADRKLPGDYYLTDVEKKQIKDVAEVFHAQNKKVIAVLNIGGVIDVMEWRDDADAILLAWQPGLEGGNAMADVLSGKVNPSGKLAATFPASYNDVPSAKNFPGKELTSEGGASVMGIKVVPAEVTYEEGIYVGYRYYSTFNVKPAYEFGYGLSYTTFKYSDLKISATNFSDNLTANIAITNTGNVPGKEVAEVYISAPVKKLDKPALELKAFAKTGLLKPGESQTLSFTITAADLASYDTKSSSWIAEAGMYSLKIGSSSLKIEQTAAFNLAKDIVVEKDQKALTPQVQINELKKGKL
jgi:beta-glucosidase